MASMPRRPQVVAETVSEPLDLPSIEHIFEHVVELCVQAGLVWGQELLFDGTKVRAKPEWAGKAIKCPNCQGRIKVPGGAATPAAVRGAANSVPHTKRISGPWLQAAGAPTKCRPGTVLSNPWSSCGWPLTRPIRAVSCGARKSYLATSTL